MQRDSFVMYRSFWEAMEELPDGEVARSMRMIARYALYGEVLEEKGIARSIFLMAKPQIDANNERYLNGQKGASFGKRGGRPKKPQENPKETPTEPQENPKETPNENVNENVLKEKPPKGGKKKSAERFSPPTLQEVEAYIAEKGYNVDPECFIDHYQSIGWMNGNTPITDWKARVRNWNRSQRQEWTAKGQRQDVTARKNRFHNFREHDYDYNAIMQQAVRQNIERYQQ